jgi:hypothetical protein
VKVCVPLDSTEENAIISVIVKIIHHATPTLENVSAIGGGSVKLANRNALVDILDLAVKRNAIKMKICRP